MAQPLRIDYEAVEAELCRRSLRDFIVKAWPLVVPPGWRLEWNWHLDALIEVLESVTRGELKRVIINIPPGFMKSLMVSVFWPAWEWASDPGLSYLTFSYSDANTIRDNRKVRDLVTSEWYQRHYPLRLASDQSAKVRFDTTARGWRIASSVGGTGTGEHPKRIIIDDASKADEALSEVERKGVADWFDRTVSTRIANDPAMIVVGQRLHVEDLPGHLLAKGGDWELVCFPMHFDPARRDNRDQRTEPRELLWPSRWPESKVRDEELNLGPFGSAGQLEQLPVPEGGGLFKRHWFRFVQAAPAKARRCRGWDTAATEGGGDWTSGVRLAVADDGVICIEDVRRDQLGPAGVNALMLQTAQSDGRAVLQREGREPAAAGKAVIAARAKLLAGYDYAEEATGGDKATRAGPFRAQAEAGNVTILVPDPNNPPPWVEPYLQVMESFPTGKYDDDVDGTSTAYNALVATPTHEAGSAEMGRNNTVMMRR